MNPGDVIPLAGMITGILSVAAIGWTLARVFNGPVGQALARRIHGRGAGSDPDLLNEVLELRQQVEQLQARLTDTEERLDFSERLLAAKPPASLAIGGAAGNVESASLRGQPDE
jgi:hypothetical protein